MKKKKTQEDNILKLAGECSRILDGRKAKDVLLLDLKRINSYLEYFIIATGNSFIHCRTLSKEVQRYLKESGLKERTKSRLDTGWIAIDYDEIVVHIFVQELRDYYQLEKLWADADFIEF